VGCLAKQNNVDDVYMGGPPIPEEKRMHMLHIIIIIGRSNLILGFSKLMSFSIGLLVFGFKQE